MNEKMVQIATPAKLFLAKLIKYWEEIDAPIAKSQEVQKWKSENW